ncbi:long polar fimbrial protein LpfA [Salmonella enterica]|nr:long polar fimbrial protein LpfA [Salmonella enterica]ECF1925626.1 long polar fimbrial protein LpfA [Salmonella enterica subsp. enterica serovar Newport]
MRNKIILAMAAAGMMCASSAFADSIPTSDAGGGTMTFTGSVINAPCSIAPDTQNINVDLGQVSKGQLSTTGALSDPQKITIHLTGCSFKDLTGESNLNATNYSKVAVSFTNVTPPHDVALTAGQLANTAAVSPATNVAVQLQKGDASTAIDLSKSPEAADGIQLDTSSKDNDLILYARMVAVGGPATVGNVSATATYKLKYF